VTTAPLRDHQIAITVGETATRYQVRRYSAGHPMVLDTPSAFAPHCSLLLLYFTLY